MSTNTVVIFGAGATKACGGPLTCEILPQAYSPQLRAKIAHEGLNDLIQREGYADLLEEFLVENFHLPYPASKRQIEDYPALPLLLSLIDTAIDRKQPFGPTWVPERILNTNQPGNNDRRSLVDVRQSLEYIIFAILEYKLRHIEQNHYFDLLERLYPQMHFEPTIISLNYDIIVDNAMVRLSEKWWPTEGRFPMYTCAIKTPAYRDQLNYFGKLLKLHGSLNWLYCPGCHRLDLGVSASSQKYTVKVLDRLYQENPLEPRYSCHGSPCEDCGVFVRPILITPTYLKDYRNPHISQVWYQAESVLREADHAIFIGYSLPDDDVDVVYLLKRSLTKPSQKITVVEYDSQDRPLKNHPVGIRYRSLFGDNLDWRNKGFEDYVKSLGS